MAILKEVGGLAQAGVAKGKQFYAEKAFSPLFAVSTSIPRLREQIRKGDLEAVREQILSLQQTLFMANPRYNFHISHIASPVSAVSARRIVNRQPSLRTAHSLYTCSTRLQAQSLYVQYPPSGRVIARSGRAGLCMRVPISNQQQSINQSIKRGRESGIKGGINYLAAVWSVCVCV